MTNESNGNGTIEVDFVLATETDALPLITDVSRWATAALRDQVEAARLTITVVDADKSQELNAEYRGKDKPTNVLSFPAGEMPDEWEDFLGDIVLCAPVVAAEADAAGKALADHYAHLVVHGCLHLLGFDHLEEEEANAMEALETVILEKLGYPDPYAS